MFDYALTFYDNHLLLFYLFLIIAVILEWPITILAFSLIAVKFKISFFEVFIFSFIWEFFWDLLHYTIWRFFIWNIFKYKNFSILKKIQKKLKNNSLFEQLLVIKYTPIITNIWLLYLWYKKTNLIVFIKTVSIFAIINGIIITSIWFNFWYLFKDKSDFDYFIVLLFLAFLLFYFLIKIISKYVIKNFINKKI